MTYLASMSLNSLTLADCFRMSAQKEVIKTEHPLTSQSPPSDGPAESLQDGTEPEPGPAMLLPV